MSKFFEQNMTIKLVSLSVSFFLWLYVMSVVDPIDSRDVMVNTVNFVYEGGGEKEFVPIGSLPTIRLRLRGRSSDISKLISNPPPLTGIIISPKTGTNDVALKVELSSKFSYELIPSDISVELDELKVQSRPIEVVTFNRLATDKEIKVIESNIKSSYIEGAESILNKVDKVVAGVDLGEQTEDFSEKVKLEAIDEEGKIVPNVTLSPEYVFVKVVLNHKKTLPIEPAIFDENGNRLSLSAYKVTPETITLTGEAKVLNRLESVETSIINSEDISDKVDRFVSLNLPAGVLSSVREVQLKKELKNIGQKELDYFPEDYVLRGFDEQEEQKLRRVLPTVRCTLSFSKELEDEVQKERVSVVLDKKMRDKGTGKVPILCESDLPLDQYMFDITTIRLDEELGF